ncbi:MAG: MFS transporter [Pirellulales bacterium]|nr:MFS transporter [Pirellulales bacterium]
MARLRRGQLMFSGGLAQHPFDTCSPRPVRLVMSERTPGKASLAVIFLTVFIDLLGFGMVLPLLPSYASEFNVDSAGIELGLLMASFSAMQLVFAPFWGRLSDRIGRRPVIMVGLAASALCYLLFGVATVYRSLGLMFASRIGAGMAGATIPTAQAYIADCTTLEKRARGMALIGVAFGLGFMLGPLLGAVALVTASAGGLSPWPGYVAAGLSAVALSVAIFALPESRDPSTATHREGFDWASLRMALTTPSVGLLILNVFVNGVAFANLESTLSLLLKARFDTAGEAAAAAAAVGSTGHDVNERILLVFAYIGFVLTFAQGFLVRRLSARVPEGTMATVGSIAAIVGFVFMALVARSASLGLLLVALTIEITGFAMITPSLNSLISRRTDPAKQGGILGINQSAAALARIFGPMLGVMLFFQGVVLPFWVAAALMVVSLVLVLAGVRSGHDFVPEK